MSEPRRLWIEGPAGRIEAVLRNVAKPRACAVVAHPHPSHGGTLDNAVVFHADRELHRAGWTTLRFNFRGVGASDGEHDDGRGEVEDFGAAAAWLRGLASGSPLVGVGYSFGSWCGLRYAATDRTISGFVGIGLPVGIYDLRGTVRSFGRPLAVVQGTRDEFGSIEDVLAVLALADPPGRLQEIDGAEHLFPRRAAEVGRAVAAVGDVILGSERNP